MKVIVIIIFTAVISAIFGALLTDPIRDFLYSKDPKLIANGDYQSWESPNQNENEFDLFSLITVTSTPSVSNTDKEINTNSIRSFWRITVKNEGVTEAEDLILHVPSSGWYKISSGKAESFTETIRLGNLKQGDSVNVKFWLKDNVSSFLRGDL